MKYTLQKVSWLLTRFSGLNMIRLVGCLIAAFGLCVGCASTRTPIREEKCILQDWSADGAKLLVMSKWGADVWDLGTIDLRTGRVYRLTDVGPKIQIISAVFSPDGRQVAYGGTENLEIGQKWRIYIVDEEGVVVHQLINEKSVGIAGWPDWSPDGKWILYSGRFFNLGAGHVAADIWRVSSIGGKAEKLTSSDAHDGMPCFSPDGKQIAFRSGKERMRDLYIIETSPGPPAKQLTSGMGVILPSWSPDGAVIAFSSRTKGGIWSVTPEGNNLTQLIADEFCWELAWSPDSSKIAFTRRVMENDEAKKISVCIWDVAKGKVVREF